ncbi:MAG TPA: PRC-barrel domain-containing protein [Woeseiaceae bacterium]
MKNETRIAVPLKDAPDFEVADHDPDVRGWEVKDANGARIGEVDQLLVDTDARKVRYLDVGVDSDLLETKEERHILIPIGSARLDRGEEHVRVDRLRAVDLAQLPEYRHEPLTHDYEIVLRQRFDPDYKAAKSRTGDFYAHEIYDSDRFYL